MRPSVRSIVTASLALIAGCTAQQTNQLIDDFASTFGETVPIPDGDTSPPVVTLTIPDLGDGQGEIVVRSGDPTRTVHVGGLGLNGFFVVAAAEDPQGVQAVCLLRAGERTCSKGGFGEHQTIHYVAACDGVTPTPGGIATTRRWLPVQVVVLQDLFPCSAGATGQSTLTVQATGTNFGGQQVGTATVIFVNP